MFLFFFFPERVFYGWRDINRLISSRTLPVFFLRIQCPLSLPFGVFDARPRKLVLPPKRIKRPIRVFDRGVVMRAPRAREEELFEGRAIGVDDCYEAWDTRYHTYQCVWDLA